MKNVAIIGANYGDEGKGLAVDYFSNQFEGTPLIVRHNGGAQAGHTVCRNNETHVFNTFGAGTLNGCKTYLSKNFIINLDMVKKEREALLDVTKIHVHAQCRVSTIFDVAMNMIVESRRHRNGSQHGSCGLGINETIARSEQYPIFISDLFSGTIFSKRHVINMIREIQEKWLPARVNHYLEAEGLNLLEEIDPWTERFNFLLGLDAESIYHKMMVLAVNNFTLIPPHVENGVIFEGAQGLGLDMELGHFPHVTHSITGLPSAMLAAHELNIKELEAIYMTRSYVTRHGAGHLENEGEWITDKELYDHTNVENAWQGNIRYAPLNLHVLDAYLKSDISRSSGILSELLNVKVTGANLFVTCMDQLGTKVSVNTMYSGGQQLFDTKHLLGLLQDELDINVIAASYGKTHKDVKQFAPRKIEE
jgi:adenylosuccinate synthase